MHELTIARNIVEILEEELSDAPGLQVFAVDVLLGPLSGVVAEALQFCWDLATEDTRLSGARLLIELTEVVGYCPECCKDCVISNIQSIKCPSCSTPVRRIKTGNELEIHTVEVRPDAALAI